MTSSRPILLIVALFACTSLLLTACGVEDVEESNAPPVTILEDPDMGEMDDEEDAPEETPPEVEYMRQCEGDVYGKVYQDQNNSSSSLYVQRIDDQDRPLVDHEVRLIGADATVGALSCDDGAYGFDVGQDGSYVVQAGRQPEWFSTSSSQGLRFGDAVASGSIKVVVFGDSIPAFGPKPWFPERFKGIVDELAEVELVNIAVPGSTSTQWLPSEAYFTSTLAPEVADADLIVFSLGGNDLYEFAMVDPNTQPIGELVGRFEELVEEIQVNIRAIITSLRMANSDADIVWLLYPNYAKTTQWEALVGADNIGAIDLVLSNTLNRIRKELAHHGSFLMWDMFSATEDVDLSAMLSDPLHLNAEGHALYARELFKVLGGVVVEDGAVQDPERLIGFGEQAE